MKRNKEELDLTLDNMVDIVQKMPNGPEKDHAIMQFRRELGTAKRLMSTRHTWYARLWNWFIDAEYTTISGISPLLGISLALTCIAASAWLFLLLS